MSIKGKRILIVEDNTMNRVVYQITLGVAGAYLTYDRNGRNSLFQLQGARDWDLVILDLMLRDGISGFDIFKEIRANPEYEHIPIIAISAAEPETAIPRAQALGFSGFISKPIDEALIVNQIEIILNGEQIWYTGTVDPRIL